MITAATRTATLELRSDGDDLTVTGYASTFNQPYDMGWYEETVAPGAFTRTLANKPDVRFLINHGGLPLARTSSGTLRLEQDSVGLHVQANLNRNDPDVQSILPKMERGDLNQMSFAFGVADDQWSDDFGQRTLRELSLKNGDVSVVTYPANPNATIGVDAARALRSLPDDEREVVRQAVKEHGARGLMREIRLGKTISKQTAGVLQEALDHIGKASDSHQAAQDLLTGVLKDNGVDPDAGDDKPGDDKPGDGGNGDAGTEQKSLTAKQRVNLARAREIVAGL